jgi:hypothetical protein
MGKARHGVPMALGSCEETQMEPLSIRLQKAIQVSQGSSLRQENTLTHKSTLTT